MWYGCYRVCQIVRFLLIRLRLIVNLVSEFFFFNDTATTEIYTLSLHDALPISASAAARAWTSRRSRRSGCELISRNVPVRSEEHTSELQSRQYIVCRLLLEKKKKQK